MEPTLVFLWLPFWKARDKHVLMSSACHRMTQYSGVLVWYCAKSYRFNSNHPGFLISWKWAYVSPWKGPRWNVNEKYFWVVLLKRPFHSLLSSWILSNQIQKNLSGPSRQQGTVSPYGSSWSSVGIDRNSFPLRNSRMVAWIRKYGHSCPGVNGRNFNSCSARWRNIWVITLLIISKKCWHPHQHPGIFVLFANWESCNLLLNMTSSSQD